jgi:hypothetical protein
MKNRNMRELEKRWAEQRKKAEKPVKSKQKPNGKAAPSGVKEDEPQE